jgi:hypothetical protein
MALRSISKVPVNICLVPKVPLAAFSFACCRWLSLMPTEMSPRLPTRRPMADGPPYSIIAVVV